MFTDQTKERKIGAQLKFKNKTTHSRAKQHCD